MTMRLLTALLGSLLLASALADTETRTPYAESAIATIESNVVFGHKDGLAMTLDVYRPVESANGAALLFLVSGGWRSSWSPPERSLPFFAPFLEAGYAVFRVRHGSSPRYGIPDAYSDVTRAVRFVRSRADEFGVDPDRLAAMGNSAGGHLALLLGTRGDDGGAPDEGLARTPSRVAAVIALVPPTDLTIAVWESPESLPSYRQFPALDLPMERAAEFSPLEHVTPDDAPSLIIMGGADELVPVFHGERIASAFDRENVPHDLIIFPEAGHNLGDWQRVHDESIRWLNTHLAATTDPSSLQ